MSIKKNESQYDTYTGWKNRGRQVLKGEHSVVNHLGERVFHENQTAEISRIGHRDRFSYPGGKRIVDDEWTDEDDDMFRLCYDPNY